MNGLLTDVLSRRGRLVMCSADASSFRRPLCSTNPFCLITVGADLDRQWKARTRFGYSHLPISETAKGRQQDPGRCLQETWHRGQGVRAGESVRRAGCRHQGASRRRQEARGARPSPDGTPETRGKASRPCSGAASHDPAGSTANRPEPPAAEIAASTAPPLRSPHPPRPPRPSRPSHHGAPAPTVSVTPGGCHSAPSVTPRRYRPADVPPRGAAARECSSRRR